jgi:F-type H+-transporting ATPase subunit gamma
MPELRELQRKLDSVKALGEVVGAMRNLAAIYVRRAEAAVAAVRPYSEVVETCLAVLLERPGIGDLRAEPRGRGVALVFSSDQGLCGAYNERVTRAALDFKQQQPGPVDLIAIGQRGHDLLAMRDAQPVLSVPSPTSLEGIKAAVPGLAADVYEKYLELDAVGMFFIYNAYEGMGRFKERTRQVLPPRGDTLAASRAEAFHYEPILTAAPVDLLGAFIEEYFFIELYRALFESHCSENGARLLAMTAAAGNIDERDSELTHMFQSVRQDVITAELLDVVGGAEALRQDTCSLKFGSLSR